MEDLPIRALAEHDTAMRVRLRAARGDRAQGLAILDELDHEAGAAEGN